MHNPTALINSPVTTLKKDSEYRRVYRKGHSKATQRIVLYVMKRYIANGRGNSRPYSSNVSRIGISVSTKVGNAVIRNKIRRRVKEIFRLSQTQLKPGFDLIVVARGIAAEATYAELEHDLRYLLSKLEITNEDSANKSS